MLSVFLYITFSACNRYAWNFAQKLNYAAVSGRVNDGFMPSLCPAQNPLGQM